MQTRHFAIRLAALLLMLTGYGWAGGHYIPADAPLVAYLFQFLVIGFLFSMGLLVFANADRSSPGRRAATALGVFAGLSLLINIANVVHGALTHDPHAFGSHNTFADLVPITLLIAGSGLWVSTMRRGAVSPA